MARRRRHTLVRPFLGSEALAAGVVNRYQLAHHHDRIFRDVYVHKGQIVSPADKAVAAWLWSRRRSTVAGLSAAALHGCRWIDRDLPAELNQPSRHGTSGIIVHSDALDDDERCVAQGIPATTLARTAFDLGRRPGLTTAVVRIDALLQTRRLKKPDVAALIDRHCGARGLVQLRRAIELSDAGAESPQETRTRLILVGADLPSLRTQIEVYDRYKDFVGRIDMGWPIWKVGVEYDGVQHWTDPAVRRRDIERSALLEALGWRIVRVSSDMLRRAQKTIVARSRAALHAAGCPL